MFFVAALATGLLVALFVLAQQSRSEADKASCRSHLMQLGLAMHNYLAANGTFPPAYVADSQGRPMHSWRVLILPYLEGGLPDDVYREYDFTEPWDGPNNRRLIERIPYVYQCPHNRKAPLGMTSYVAIVGDESAWPRNMGRAPLEFKDGLSNTVLVAETADRTIPWTEPRDIDFAKMDFFVDAASGYGVGSSHRGSATVLLADGRVRHLPASISPTVLKGLLTVAGGEPVSPP